jgi:hypothetical protein
MDISHYRQIQSRVALSQNGEVPETPLCLDNAEQEALIDRITGTWMLVEAASTTNSRLPARNKPTSTEKWTGLKRWFVSHHIFILQLALTAHCLKEAVRQSADSSAASRWANLASRLRKGCGALFLYAIDFQPCATIYCGAIRSDMPQAFSGYWIRERQHYFQPALVRFNRSFKIDPQDKFNLSPGNNWALAEKRYHELHEASMHLAVEDGKSLASQYREENGKPHRISKEEFRQYDTWFAIERRPDASRLDYVFQVCDLIERAVGDLITGHRLEAPVMAELLDGFRAALAVFGNWAGPVPEGSRFYPKHLRGE